MINMLSKKVFINQILDLAETYKRDNAWVGMWKVSWNDPLVMAGFINAAYKLYAATATNALSLTLLGGTEVRKNESLIQSFGITAANGIQDKETKDHVADEFFRRGLICLPTNELCVKPTGVGSILSEKSWTPILNDALILGAITSQQDFAVAFTPEEQEAWLRTGALGVQELNKTMATASYADVKLKKDVWKKFLNDQQQMFFDNNGIPRVFTRELLGLSFFGYTKQFEWQQLSFHTTPENRQKPDFKTYVKRLRAIQFQSPTNKKSIMKHISRFLFDDPEAVGSNW